MKRTLIQIFDKEPDIRNFIGSFAKNFRILL